MTKIKLFDVLPKDQLFSKLYTTLDISYASDAKAMFIEEGDNGDRIVLRGENFTYNGTTITGGTVTGMNFTNSEGDVYAVATKMHFDASKFVQD